MNNNFLFVSAENDGIPNCKAGGMGDVVRDVPRHIAARGDTVNVVTPSYGRLHQQGKPVMELNFSYRGYDQQAVIYEVPGKKILPGIAHYVIDHPDIKSGDIAHIYYNDPVQPFFQDANAFSLFCIAVAEAVKQGVFGKPDVVHLHDWHTSLLLFLKKYHPSYAVLRNSRWVYSIHNLAIQGIRPFRDNASSLEAFYPEVVFNAEELVDPRYPDCINLMAVGIRHADAVHTVSPSYREDVQQASKPPHFIGGEGLEADLKKADKEGRLFGILNGCNYNNIRVAEKGWLWKNTLSDLFIWLQQPNKKYKSDFLAHTGHKITRLLSHKPDFVCCSVARLTEQKFYFYKEDPDLLRELLDILERRNGVYIILGTGAPEYEELFRSLSYERENFLFINAQSEDVIDSLYLESDLYLMPSLFEPCGISQMLAMRNGQPCLVNHTGGLKDTVAHMKTGFAFEGETLDKKKRSFVKVFKKALDLYFDEPEKWKAVCRAASEARFSWENSVDDYYRDLYKLKDADDEENGKKKKKAGARP
ncbi:glycogen synthase [Robertkochia aurantiaca]|uniref:glycogen synthase n=1 Tax=Robertkochia aurantiaca TaxID=2873700 RepID=UPI001CCBCD24